MADENNINPKDPFYWTEVIDSEGKRFRAAPEDIDSVLKDERFKLWNDNQKVKVKRGIYDEAEEIDAKDVKSYLDNGYSLGVEKVNQYNTRQDDLAALAKPSPVQLSGLEKTLGFVTEIASGATFGVSDVLARGIYELEGLVTGDDEKVKEGLAQLREVRDNLGVGGVVANVLGAVLTGGASLAAKGTGLAAKAGLGALEGALMGASGTLARDVIEDPTVSFEDYLFSAGIGGVIGGALGGIGRLGEALSGKGQKILHTQPVDIGALKTKITLDDNVLSPLVGKGAAFENKAVPIMRDNKMIGEVVLSRNAQGSYHKGSNFGVALEDVKFTQPVSKEEKIALLSHLTDNFDSVSTPTKTLESGASKNAFDLVNRYGVSHVADGGERWAQATSTYLPDFIEGESLSTSLRRKIVKMLGKVPDEETDPIGYSLFNRVTDPDQGILRDDVLEFMADKAQANAKVYKAFKGFHDTEKKAINAFGAMKRKFGEGLTDDKALLLKERTHELLGEIDTRIEYLSNYAGDDVNKLSAELKNLRTNLSESLNETEPSRLWNSIYDARERFKSTYKSSEDKIKMRGSKSNMGVLNETYHDIKDLLANEKVIGKVNADDWVKLDKASEEAIKASKEFHRLFSRKVGKNDYSLDEEKVRRVWTKASDTYGEEALNNAKVSMINFIDSVESLSAAKGKSLGFPSKKELLQAVSSIDEVRQVKKISQLLTKLNGGTTTSAAVESGTATAASMIIYGAASSAFGPIGGALASAFVSPLINAAQRNLANPTNMLVASQNKTNSRIYKAASEAAERIINTSARVGLPKMIDRAMIASQLNVSKTSDHREYLEQANKRFEDMARPNYIKYQVEHLPEEIQPVAAKRLQEIAVYVSTNLPKVKAHQTPSLADAMKADKLLAAVTSPATALRLAASGDTDSIKHLQALYPSVSDRFQSILAKELEGVDMLKLPYQKRLLVEQLTGTQDWSTSLGAAKLSQGVHQKKKQSENPSITQEAPLTGDAIQSQ